MLKLQQGHLLCYLKIMAAFKEMRPTYAQVLPPAVRILLILNIAVFAIQKLFDHHDYLEEHFALWPIIIHSYQHGYEAFFEHLHFMPWQLLTYGFLHANFNHIFFNAFGLWMFGKVLEEFLGTKRFTIYFLTCIIGAAVLQLIYSTWASYHGMLPAPTIGASGGLFGLLLAFGVFFPRSHIYLFFLPIGIEARYFVIIYGLLELFSSFNTSSHIAHLAHVGGMLTGGLIIAYWAGKLPIKPKRILYWNH